MFATLRRFAGNIKVSESKDIITIEGVGSRYLEASLQKLYKTSKVYKNIFHIQTYSSVGFYSFFAIEVDFMLAELLNVNYGQVSAFTLKSIREQLKENTWLRTLEDEKASILNRNRLKDFIWSPLPHQEEFFDIFDKNVPKYGLKGYVLGASMGSGKTITSLFTAHMTQADTVIVVSPNNAIDDPWRETINKVYKENVKVDLWVSNDKKPPTVGKTHYVLHYEYLSKFLDFFKANKNSFKNVFVILDESHNLNESTPTHSKRTQSFIDLCVMSQVKYVIWQSGTPVKAMGNEVIPMLKTIDEKFTPGAEGQFRSIFGKEAKRAIDILAHRIGLLTYVVASVVKEPTITRWDAKLKNGNEFTLEFIAAKMKEFILERMKHYEDNQDEYIATYFRCIDEIRNKRVVPEIQLDEYLTMTNLLHTQYDPKIHKEEPKIANKFEETHIIPNLSPKDKHLFRDARSVYKYYWLKVQGEALGRILGKERSRCSTELALAPDGFVDKTNNEKCSLENLINKSHSKTVIFSNYVNTVEKVAEHLTSLGFKPVIVHGETKESVHESVSRFANDKELDPIVTTYKSLSTAVPLVMASNSIMIDQPFRDYERVQAIARTARLGQKENVQIQDLYLDTGNKPNISTRSKDIMEWSMQQVQAIMKRTVVSEITLESLDSLDNGLVLRNAMEVINLENLDSEVELSVNPFIKISNNTKLLEW